jgi:hypothetical protein
VATTSLISISSTMMARLMLNLLKVNAGTSDQDAPTDSSQDSRSSPNFSRVELDTLWTSDLEHHRSVSGM